MMVGIGGSESDDGVRVEGGNVLCSEMQPVDCNSWHGCLPNPIPHEARRNCWPWKHTLS